MSRVLDLVNEAQLAVDANEKVTVLHRLKEVVLERSPPPGLQEYAAAMDGLAAMASERNVNVAKTICQFIEDAMDPARNASIKSPPVLSKTRFTLFQATAAVLTINAGPSAVRKALKLLDKYVPATIFFVWTQPLDALDESVWLQMLDTIQILQHIIDQLQDAESILLAARVLETVALHFSYATDSVHRDPARSNVQPDAVHLAMIPASHRFVRPEPLADLGQHIVHALCNRLSSAPRHPMLSFGRREFVSFIHSISLIACLRTDFAPIVVPCLVNFPSIMDTVDARVQDTLLHAIKANLIKLLRLPLPSDLQEDMTNTLIAMDASKRALEALSKSKETRRMYVAAPTDASLKNLRRDDAKRRLPFDASSLKSKRAKVEDVKPTAITAESIVNLPNDHVVRFVLGNMGNLPAVAPLTASGVKLELLHTPSALKDRITSMLSRLATPSSVLALAMNAKKTAAARRDPRLRRDNVKTEAPSLLPAFDDNSLESVTNIVCANAQTLVEPIISVTKDEVTREYNAIRVNIKPVSDDWCRQMAHLSISRMLENEYGILTSGHEGLREALICRLATSRWLLEENARDAKSIHKLIVDFVGEALHKRHMILVSLAYHEYTRSLYDSTQSVDHGRYPRLLQLVCAMLSTRIDPSVAADKKLFYAILSHFPGLTKDVLAMLAKQLGDAADNQRLIMGVSALRNYITDRAAGQEACLHILLHFATHVEEATRNLTIRCLANQIYPLPKMHEIIEAHAMTLMTSLCEAPADDAAAIEDDQDEAKIKMFDDVEEALTTRVPLSPRRKYYLDRIVQPTVTVDDTLLAFAKELQKEHDFSVAPESEAHVLQRMELFLALCAKKPELFAHFVSTYARASPPVQHVLVTSVDKLIKHLKQREGDAVVLAQLQPFPATALDFVGHVVRLLVSLSRDPSTLVEPLLALYNAHATYPDAVGLLIPIVSEMTTDVFLPLLPRFFQLPPARLTETMTKLLAPIPLKVDPTALLLALHHVPDEAERQKPVLKAIGMCLEHPAVFTPDVFQTVITTLVQESPIPKFTMRTMIQAVQLYSKLRKPMASSLEALVVRELWTMDETLWKGFMKCAVVVQPHSFPVLLQLPLEQGQSILEMDEGKDLLEPFKAFCTKDDVVLTAEWRTYLGLDDVTLDDEVVKVDEEEAVKAEPQSENQDNMVDVKMEDDQPDA
ncbi:hypothetical protein SPRG_04950 [Saprolegnia parasitica CBS 223.65]|uniref:Symplekin C-terminal domain-containing protein n=1 Tax=Saprolegnia parasitica (strain CBS 223.65) TaxID=695850 RepID=A0A067CHA2_SAPPC|nr:hypothetical protein SPRG_04950 [Saprolegnia parasitica CBS 223.65]KDO29883.1 hypothetical protein SPRG_04950 [Saprolegnia parasitica CBS 223.65]|eukprot:XP_012199478.1 hypothetical protein SPRG_04950 [Saprolegnia parasitica CBS 223.65]